VTENSWLGRWALLLVLALLVVGFSFWLPDTFATVSNARDIVISQPPLIFLAFAALITLVVGEFDLSLGANIGICQYLVMELMVHSQVSWPLTICIVLCVGMLIGAANAVMVVGFGLNSFIVTIGVATVLEGLLQLVSDGGTPIFGGVPKSFLDIGQTELLGLTLPVFYALAAAGLLWLMLERTVLGRQMRATGANAAAARLSGIPTWRATALAFVIAGGLAAIGGILATARIGAADATSGPSLLLPAFAAAFLGATAVKPGFFNVWGTVIAIFLVAVGITGLQLQGVEAWVTPVFNGVVLLIAIGVARLASTRKPRDSSETGPPARPSDGASATEAKREVPLASPSQ
jgi:ribose transport system permease protein